MAPRVLPQYLSLTLTTNWRYQSFPCALLLETNALTFTGVEVQCGPSSVSAARRGDAVDTAIKPVAGVTLERDTAVVRRRRY